MVWAVVYSSSFWCKLFPRKWINWEFCFLLRGRNQYQSTVR